MALALRFTARTHVGLVREGNEDSAYVGPHLLVLADGMGGHAAGEVASAAAITTFASIDTEEVDDPAARLRLGVAEADAALQAEVEEDPNREGMGTTLTGLYWDGAALTLVHIGDSRAYRLRAGELEQISHDHTYVQTLVDEGRITPEQAHHHPQRSLILRALDGRGKAEPDVGRVEAREGDRFLICSDGLSDYVAYAAIVSAVTIPDMEAAADRLVALALAAGAPDNVTVVLADLVNDEHTGVLPPMTDEQRPLGAGFIVGAVAEDEAERIAAAADSEELPDRRLHDPEEDTEENREEELRYALREPSRWRWIRRIAIIAVALGVVAGIAWAGWSWTRTQYYVGAEGDHLAIFQGIEQRVLGQPLSEVYEVSEVPLEQLPTYDRRRVEATIKARGVDDAVAIVERLTIRAETCERYRAEAAENKDQNEGRDEPGAQSTQPTTATPAPPTDATASASVAQQTSPGVTSPPTTRPTRTTRTPTPTFTPPQGSGGDFSQPVTRQECGVSAP